MSQTTSSIAASAGADPLLRGIGIRCDVKGSVITQVSIEPRRPPPIERLLQGKPTDRLEPTLDLIFSVCGHAHRLAARQALASAQGRALPAAELRRLEILRNVENIREHALNLLQSLPQESLVQRMAREFIGATQSLAALVRADVALKDAHAANVRARLQAALQALFGRFWLLSDSSLDEVLGWARHSDAPAARILAEQARPGYAEFGACAVPALPLLSAQELEQSSISADADTFAATPAWGGGPCETSCFARQAEHPLVAEASRRHGSGLLARSVARMVETVKLAERLAGTEEDLPSGPCQNAMDGAGFAQVEASRGRLLHWVTLEQGRVKRYRILAPTEWNFHPRGLVYQALLGATAGSPDDLQIKTRSFLHAVDPCVPFDLEFVCRPSMAIDCLRL